MCSACGFPPRPGHWAEAGTADAHGRLVARFRRAEVLRRVLAAYGLTVHDGGLVPGIQVGTLSGRQEIVPDLAGVWTLAEEIAGRPVDPLDPRFTGGAATG